MKKQLPIIGHFEIPANLFFWTKSNLKRLYFSQQR